MSKYDILIGAFSVIITVLSYIFSRKIAEFKILKPIPTVLIGACIIIAIVEFSPITYEQYSLGGDIIVWLLAPATVALAYPLYQFSRLLKQNAAEIFFATVASSLISIFTMILLGKFFGLNSEIINSLLSKCVTTPVALEISNMTNGIAGLTICGVFISGLFGSMIGHSLLKLCKVKSDISIGLAMGATSHVIGTSKCLQVSEKQSAMSALVLVLVAIFTTSLFSILSIF